METREQAEQAAVRWIAQRETGPWSEEDAAAFEAWLAGSTTRQVAYYRFKRTWQEAGRLKALASGGLPDRPLSSLFEDEATLPEARVAPLKSGRLRYALAACVLLTIAAAVLVPFRNEIFGFNSYKTAVGGLATVPLPDGSRVILNTDSKLRVSMNEQVRRIELERGEAFFDVAKDPNRPFVVTVADKQVIAVGTQFSVRRQGEDVRVSVTEGAVRLIASPVPPSRQDEPHPETDERGQGVLLAAGTVARAASVGVLVEKKAVEAIEQELTWRAGILTFRDTPLVEAVAEFNRYNARKIFIEDPEVAAIEVGGVFRSTDLAPFIRLIEDGLALNVTEQGDRIILSAR